MSKYGIKMAIQDLADGEIEITTFDIWRLIVKSTEHENFAWS